jgi:hypothetical protein
MRGGFSCLAVRSEKSDGARPQRAKIRRASFSWREGTLRWNYYKEVVCRKYMTLLVAFITVHYLMESGISNVKDLLDLLAIFFMGVSSNRSVSRVNQVLLVTTKENESEALARKITKHGKHTHTL